MHFILISTDPQRTFAETVRACVRTIKRERNDTLYKPTFYKIRVSFNVNKMKLFHLREHITNFLKLSAMPSR